VDTIWMKQISQYKMGQPCYRCGAADAPHVLWPRGFSEKIRVRACQECKYKLRKEHDRKSALKRRYGITISQYRALMLKANGRCEACGERPSNIPLCVDHCHETGIIRGLLCGMCNLLAGHLEDVSYIDRVQGVRAYLINRLTKT
jgi:hypothetical protein